MKDKVEPEEQERTTSPTKKKTSKIQGITCGICNLPTSDKRSFFKHHMQLHYGQAYKLLCNMCNVVFNAMIPYNDHFPCDQQPSESPQENIEDTSTAHVRCGICEVLYESEDILSRHHYRTHYKYGFEYKIKCVKCSLIFLSPELFDTHLRTHQNDTAPATNTKCHICYKYFDNVGDLEAHCRKEHPFGIEPPEHYQCFFCEDVFEKRSGLRRHFQLNHDDGIQYKTIGSKYSFVSRSKKYNERRNKVVKSTSTTKTTTKCHICYQVFNNIDDHRMHIKTVHPVELESKKEFKCSYCHIKFNDQILVKEHQLKHQRPIKTKGLKGIFQKPSGELITEMDFQGNSETCEHECIECSEVFQSFDELESHRKVHIPYLNVEESNTTIIENGVKVELKEELNYSSDFECVLCNACFATFDDLEIHSKLHIKLETS